MSMNSESVGSYPGTYQIAASAKTEAEALLAVIRHFKWTSSALLSGETQDSITISNIIRQEISLQYDTTASEVISD
jgi:hypothetical protein